MERTMRWVPSHCAMLSERMPAATLRCSALPVRRGFLEGLGFDGPDHQQRASQRSRRVLLCADAELRGQLLARRRKRLHYFDVVGRHALADQPADDGTGHVAAANERDGWSGRELGHGASLSLPRAVADQEDRPCGSR
jgi:hypothetical protein